MINKPPLPYKDKDYLTVFDATPYFPIRGKAMKKFRFISKLIASFLVLVLGTNQAALADEGALDFTAPDTTIREAVPTESIPQPLKKDTVNSALKSGFGANISPSSLFATKRAPGAIAVGAAEGNLTPGGQTTTIYFGHIDPGNHVVNRGFCSWNKAADLSVAEADGRCLNALQWQSAKTQQKLAQLGLDPKKYSYALVNGTDLWNQSNSAGPQFSIKYKKALDKGLKGNRALLDARVEAFRNEAGVLDASGLFGICATQPFYKSRLAGLAPYSEAWRWQCIALDQGRRIRQVDKALNLNLGDISSYSDPVPEGIPPLKSAASADEALPDLPASDASVLNFEPTVEPLPIAPAKPKPANGFSYSQGAISANKSQLNFRESPPSFPLNFDNDPEEQGTGGAAEQRREREKALSPSTPTTAKESWGYDLNKTLKLGDKIAAFEVSSPYGLRIHPIDRQAHFHAGVDLKTPTNTPLYAIGQPGTQTTLRCWTDPGGGGLVGSMTSPSFPNLQFDALHLSWCKAPTNGLPIQVKAGEVIAGTGNTGHSTGPHLHFQVRDRATGKRIPPAKGFIAWVITGKEP